jgi:hypothetical protein
MYKKSGAVTLRHRFVQIGGKMAKIMHAQTVLTVDDIEALKEKTGETSTKDALAKAVTHYLECEYTQVEDMWAKKLEKAVKRKKKEE